MRTDSSELESDTSGDEVALLEEEELGQTGVAVTPLEELLAVLVHDGLRDLTGQGDRPLLLLLLDLVACHKHLQRLAYN